MKAIALVNDPTNHPGIVSGPGSPKVKINGMSVAVMGDLHSCSMPSNPPHPPTPFIASQTKVTIGGMPVLVNGDKAGCGAAIIATNVKVMIK